MKKVIDIHSHILPGVDDGCKSKEEAIKMVKMYENQNVEAVICTPHYGPCGFTDADVDGAFNWIQTTSSSVKFFLGNEIHADWITRANIGKKGGPRTLCKSEYFLFELEEWVYPAELGDLERALNIISNLPLKPIIAHIERYEFVQNNPAICGIIAKSGAKMQLNAYDIVQNSDERCRKTSQYLLKNQLVSFIGSDAHGSVRRSPELATGVHWIYKHCPEKYADAIVHDNAAQIIKTGEA